MKNKEDKTDLLFSDLGMNELIKNNNIRRKGDEDSSSYSDTSIWYRPYNIMKEKGIVNYNALIRFIPYVEDTQYNLVSKYRCYLKKSDGTGRYIDSDTIDGNTTTKNNILKYLFFKTRDSNNPMIQRMQKMFSSSVSGYSLIQVVKDDVEPENNGKIFLYQFGKRIFDKILNEVKPTIEFIKPSNPYKINDAKLFQLSVRLVSLDDNPNVKIPDYSNSTFVDGKTNLIIDGKPITNSEEDKKRAIEFLKENSHPELLQMKFNGLSDEDKEFIADFVINQIPDDNFKSETIKAFPDIFHSNILSKEDEIDETNKMKNVIEITEKQKQQENKKVETPDESSDEDDGDDDDFDWSDL